jgi:hypothetical protein
VTSGRVVAAGLGILLLASGCTGGLGAATAGPATPPSSVASTPPTTSADEPSEPARIVCQDEAQEDIERVLGVPATLVGPPTYVNHVSDCRYRYPDGSFDLTVHDLPDDAATTALYTGLAARQGHVRDLQLPGAEAFVAGNGSVIMRKDTEVLLVDITDLPRSFGHPAVTRADAALLITNAILGCWT